LTKNQEIDQTETTGADDSDAIEVASQNDPQENTSREDAANSDAETIASDTSLEEDTHDKLRAKLVEAESQVAINLDGWQRTQADYQNYKRRMARDLEQARENTAASILSRFFPVLDDLQLALDSIPDPGDGAQWSEGVNLVHRKLIGLLEAEKITPVDAAPGQQFDPRFHEAVIQEEHPNFQDGEITAVLRPGYQLGKRVLRAAQVRVAE
jgi:molecular chaperone GrpE